MRNNVIMCQISGAFTTLKIDPSTKEKKETLALVLPIHIQDGFCIPIESIYAEFIPERGFACQKEVWKSGLMHEDNYPYIFTKLTKRSKLQPLCPQVCLMSSSVMLQGLLSDFRTLSEKFGSLARLLQQENLSSLHKD